MTLQRHYSFWDKCCLSFDQALQALTDNSRSTGRPYPGETIVSANLDEEKRKHSAGLMRVNHTGEICAQALYHGQAHISKSKKLQKKLAQAAIEEGDHLHWCKHRLDELQSHTSYLNPFWYTGAFCMGVLAGAIGDKWSLGFVVETERQVIEHLEKHLALLPNQDQRSHIVLQQMEKDEAKHRDEAEASGAAELPVIVKKLMRFASKVMVKTAYWI